MGLELFVAAVVIYAVAAIVELPDHSKTSKIFFGLPFDHEQSKPGDVQESFETPLAGLSYTALYKN